MVASLSGWQGPKAELFNMQIEKPSGAVVSSALLAGAKPSRQRKVARTMRMTGPEVAILANVLWILSRWSGGNFEGK